MWLIVAIVVIGLIIASSISGNSDALKKAEAQKQFTIAASDRGKAYAQYLRRTSTASRIKSMTDFELLDFVMSNIRAYKKDCESRDQVGAVIVGLGFVVSLFVILSGELSWIAFFILWGLSFAGAFAYVENQNKEILRKYQALDLEIEQLEVK